MKCKIKLSSIKTVFVITCLIYFPIFTNSSLAKQPLPKPKNTETVSPKEENSELPQEEIVEEEKINPVNNYKLIGIYIIEKKPKAIIKDLLNPENSGDEFGVGDYLDEMKTVSISKITLSPTARVELIDNQGVSYLMKPSIPEQDISAMVSSPTYSSPSSSSNYKFSNKSKYKPPKNIPNKKEIIPPQDQNQDNSPPPQAQEPLPQNNPTPPPSDAPQNTPPPAQDTGASVPPPQQNTPPPQQAAPAGGTDAFGRERPKNPFE